MNALDRFNRAMDERHPGTECLLLLRLVYMERGLRWSQPWQRGIAGTVEPR